MQDRKPEFVIFHRFAFFADGLLKQPGFKDVFFLPAPTQLKTEVANPISDFFCALCGEKLIRFFADYR